MLVAIEYRKPSVPRLSVKVPTTYPLLLIPNAEVELAPGALRGV